MSNALILVLALGAGLLLGLLFFGGLWWTVRRGMASPHPAVWFLGSMLLRTSLVLVGFYVVSAGHWERLLMCFGGFILARFVVASATGRRDQCALAIPQEARHAPEP